MRTSSRDVALLLFDEVELLDAAIVAQVLSLAGRQWNWRPFRVTPTATRAGRVVTRGQLALEADVDLQSCAAPEIVVVPGGYGARRFVADEVGMAWLARVGQGATHLLAVGAGIGVLAKAGLLGEATVAAPKELREWLEECGAERIDPARRSVVSGRVYTAARSADATDAALSLVRALLGDKQAKVVAEGIGHPWSAAPSAKGPVEVEIVTTDG